jgi:hypothetical protein
MKRMIGSAAVVAMAAAMFGCSIHTQAPIKEVAYDFSDRDFYDRAYAPSPDYSEAAPMVAANDTPAPCPLAGSCQSGACGGGCNRTVVEHHHYYEDGADSDDRAPRRRSRPRAEADRDDASDSRQAERPARPRVHVEVEAQDAGQAPVRRTTGPARADSPAIGTSPRQPPAGRVQVDID